MILPLESHIRNPPLILAPEQVLTFNAIRYCVDIIDVSRERLYENLSELTDKNVNDPLDFPRVFLDAWSIINNAQMFGKLICKGFQINKNLDSLEEINKAKNLRDSNQHLEERVTKDCSLANLPVYGSLSWRKLHADPDCFTMSILYSGSFTNKKEPSMSISNKKERELNKVIQKIEFTNVIREKDKSGNYIFKEEILSISRLLSDVQKWIEHFDSSIQNQLEKTDVSNKHVSDLFIRIPARFVDLSTNQKTINRP